MTVKVTSFEALLHRPTTEDGLSGEAEVVLTKFRKKRSSG
jgi:hypothetical protein